MVGLRIVEQIDYVHVYSYTRRTCSVYFSLHEEHAWVLGQNGSGQNGIGQNGMDKMEWTKWYG